MELRQMSDCRWHSELRENFKVEIDVLIVYADR